MMVCHITSRREPTIDESLDALAPKLGKAIKIFEGYDFYPAKVQAYKDFILGLCTMAKDHSKSVQLGIAVALQRGGADKKAVQEACKNLGVI